MGDPQQQDCTNAYIHNTFTAVSICLSASQAEGRPSERETRIALSYVKVTDETLLAVTSYSLLGLCSPLILSIVSNESGSGQRRS